MENAICQPFMKDFAEANADSPIPVANLENRLLMKTINELVEEKFKLESSVASFTERIKKLVQHTKNAGDDMNQNLKILHENKLELVEENHSIFLKKNDLDKLKEFTKEFKKDLTDIQKYIEVNEIEIAKRKSSVNEMYKKINWSQMALDEWQQIVIEGGDAICLIQKYCKQDRNRATDLENKRCQIQLSIEKEKRNIIDLLDEQKSLEQAIDRIANLYRSIHVERRELITTWKTAVKQMNNREEDIRNVELNINNLINLLNEKKDKLKQFNLELDTKKEQNYQTELEIEEWNAKLSNIKEYLQTTIANIGVKTNEVEALLKELFVEAQKVALQRHKNRKNQKDKILKLKSLDALEAECKKLHERNKKFYDKAASAKEKLRVIDDMLASEEFAKTKITQETNQINSLLYRSQQHLTNLKNESKLLQMNIQNIRDSISALKQNTAETQKQILTQMDIHYDMSFKVQMLETKLSNMSGGDPDQGRERKMEFDKLQQNIENLNKQLSTLNSQSLKLEETMKNLTVSYNNELKNIEKIMNRIKESKKYFEGGINKKKAILKENQEKIVELSLIKMKVNDLESHISNCKNRLYDMEKDNLEFSKVIKDRLGTIQAQLKVYFLQRKQLCDEKSTLKADIGDRRIHIKAAQTRYAIALDLLGKSDDDLPLTTSALKIQAIQEKQMLIHQGNELNDKVKSSEKEIRTMENTLYIINYSNFSYKKSLDQIDENSSENLEFHSTQATLQEVLCTLKKIKHEFINCNKHLTELSEKYEGMHVDFENAFQKRTDIQNILQKLHKEIQDQKVKLTRAERDIKCSQKTLERRSYNPTYMFLYKKYIDTQEMQRRNMSSLKIINSLMDRDPLIQPVISKLLFDKHIKLPKFDDYLKSKYEPSESSLSDIYIQQSSSDTSSQVSSCGPETSSLQPSIISLDFEIVKK
ncbi:CCDC39 family protein [Megaselia abdita]